MKKRKQKKNIFIGLSYIMLVASIPMTILFSNLIGKELTNHIQETIVNSAELCVEMIERQYQNDVLLLESLAMRMSTSLEENPDEGIARMVSTAERYGMKRIAFSMPDGTTLATDGADMNLTGVDNFERASKGEMLLTGTIPDVVDGAPISVYSTPVYSAANPDKLLGVLTAVYSSDKFEEMLSAHAFKGEGYTYIVDSKGNVVINSRHHNAIQDLENMFDYLALYSENKQDITTVQNNIQTSR